MMSHLVPLEALNGLPADRFGEALTPLFEAAAPLVVALRAERPFASYGEVIDRAERLAAGLPEAQQIEVVNAHPRIGASAGELSAMSYREQGSASEAGQDLANVYAELERLNKAYEERFGFRFVVFVNGRSKADIVEVLRQRQELPRQTELRTAVEAIFLIARHRLATLQGR
jgi:2-oxo-4-hydroxy-4-carboxy-5-ureidoimidazoline decarboxylase